MTSWYDKYKDDGFVVIGVHAPEFAFERKLENVQKAVTEKGIRYPVALDNKFDTWRAYNNQYWPAHYFIDKEGKVRHTHFGEGEYENSEKVIQALLAEGSQIINKPINSYSDTTTTSRNQSPETYLGYSRAERFANAKEFKSDEIIQYNIFSKLSSSTWSLGGLWQISSEKSVSKSSDSILTYKFTAKEVYLVMGSSAKSSISISLNGKSIGELGLAGDDVINSIVQVSDYRLYKLVKSKDLLTDAVLELRFSKDIEVNAFTFGG